MAVGLPAIIGIGRPEVDFCIETVPPEESFESISQIANVDVWKPTFPRRQEYLDSFSIIQT